MVLVADTVSSFQRQDLSPALKAPALSWPGGSNFFPVQRRGSCFRHSGSEKCMQPDPLHQHGDVNSATLLHGRGLPDPPGSAPQVRALGSFCFVHETQRDWKTATGDNTSSPLLKDHGQVFGRKRKIVHLELWSIGMPPWLRGTRSYCSAGSTRGKHHLASTLPFPGTHCWQHPTGASPYLC